MRVILLGRKPVACEALRYMRSRGADVVCVVTPDREVFDPYPERLVEVAESLGIPALDDRVVHQEGLSAFAAHEIDPRNIELVVSMLHQRRIGRWLLELSRIGCINFHPAPLPEYRGWGTYNMAILEDVKRWGAAAHFADDQFDTGPLIRVHHFDVDTSQETALSLQRKTQPVLLEVFQEVFELALQDGALTSLPQGPGRSFTKREVLARRYILPGDSPEEVDRKVRAFWYPPNPCAGIRVGNRCFPVMNQAIYEQLVPLVCGQIPSEA